METRRLILAIALSLIVFVVYAQFFAPKSVEQPPVPEPRTATPEEKPKTAPPVAAPRFTPALKGQDITVETALYRAVINTAGGVIKRWELKNYQESSKEKTGVTVFFKRLFGSEKAPERPKTELGNVQLVPTYDGADPRDVVWPLTLTPLNPSFAPVASAVYQPSTGRIVLDEAGEKQALTLRYAGPAGIVIEKTLTFYADDYKVDLSVSTKGLDGYSLSLGTDFGLSDKVSSDAAGRIGAVSLVDDKLVREGLDDIKGEVRHAGSVGWYGNYDKYFTAVIAAGAPGVVISERRTAPQEIGDLLTTSLLVKDLPQSQTYLLFAGPKSYKLLQSYGKGFEQMVDYGWFGILAKPMFWLLTVFYTFARNYGIAIILLTIVVRALLFYPSLKSAMSMEEMKNLQPEMNALREKYKKDPQKMNQELMRLYKEKKVNPLGGCLPMLLQLPFFVALYNVLNSSVELRQAPFISFWIKDLSVYDPFYILPVLMGVSMIVTMKMTSATMDPNQAKMMTIMNVLFIFLFAWLPAGLNLYITVSNLLSIVQQMYVRKIIARTTPR